MAAPRTVTVGASVSRTGRYSLQGDEAAGAIEAWAEDAGAGGFILGGKPCRARAILLDDGSDVRRAAENVERLVARDRVDILLGPYGSDLTRCAAAVARTAAKVMWNHGGAADDAHAPGGRVVGILTPASRYFPGLFDLLRSRRDGGGPLARSAAFLLRGGSRFGALAMEGAAAVARGLGIPLQRVPYESAEADLPRLARRMQEMGPDLLLSAGAFQEECALARGLLAPRSRFKAAAFVAAGLQQFSDALGPLAEGVFGPSQWEPGLRYPVDCGPAAAEAMGVIRRHGPGLGYPAAQAFAACVIARLCLEEVPDAGDSGLWNAACALRCTTFFGPFSVERDSGRQTGKEMVWIQWQRGARQVVWPPDLATAEPALP